MKKIFIIILSSIIISLIISCAGQQPLPKSKLYNQKIIDVPGQTKDILFEKSLKWMAQAFNSSSDVIQYKDKTNGEIIGKGSILVSYTYTPVKTNFTLLIEIKDEKVRITFKDIGFDNWVPFNNSDQLNKFKSATSNIIYTYEKNLKNDVDKDW